MDANGGNPVQVTVGTLSNRDEMKPITLREAQTISSKAHLTSRQQRSIFSDLRSKLGRKVVEPGFKAALPVHNKKFAQYFSVEAKYFLNTDNKVEKISFYATLLWSFWMQLTEREVGWVWSR